MGKDEDGPEIRVSDQLDQAITERNLKRINDILLQVISGRLAPQSTDDEYVLTMVMRKLVGEIDHKDFHYWKKSGKIGKDHVRRICKDALAKLAQVASRDEWAPGALSGKNKIPEPPLKRINTGEYPEYIRNKRRH